MLDNGTRCGIGKRVYRNLALQSLRIRFGIGVRRIKILEKPKADDAADQQNSVDCPIYFSTMHLSNLRQINRIEINEFCKKAAKILTKTMLGSNSLWLSCIGDFMFFRNVLNRKENRYAYVERCH